MSDIAIRVENLGKQYRLGEFQRYRTFREGISSLVTRPFRRAARRGANGHAAEASGPRPGDTIWALNDVSFEVPRGQVLGIIGRNGAGKSTLLKVLSRITEPTTGRVEIHGRVGSLLEVGTGFHPELTGRENIFVNGAILGMTRAEIKRKFDEIVDFAGIDKFLDTPVKRYSSGMQVRLAFSVAAHLEPEIMIVDEVLAVGDAVFQNRCLGKMHDVATSGRTVLFVSHNLSAVRSLCERGILLTKGGVSFDGSTEDALSKYMAVSATHGSSYFAEEGPSEVTPASLVAVTLHSPNGDRIEEVQSGSSLQIQILYRIADSQSNLECALGVYNSLGQKLAHFASHRHKPTSCSQIANATGHSLNTNGIMACNIASLPFTPGQYRLSVYFACDHVQVAHIPDALIFTVKEPAAPVWGWGPAARKCAVYLPHTWGTIAEGTDKFSSL